MSVSLWALIIISVFQISNFKTNCFDIKNWKIRFVPTWTFKIPLAYVAVIVPFLLVLISGFWSENHGYWLERLRIKLPFIVLPFAFANMHPLSTKQFLTILYVFLIAFSVACGVHLTYYATHFEAVNNGLGQGIPIPTMRQHIAFTVMSAFAVFVGWELWERKFYLKTTAERYLILGLTVFLFVAIHVLSVRTALVVLYIGLIIKVLELVFRKRKFIVAATAAAILVLTPLLAYNFLPSLRQRIDYAKWDFAQFQTGDLEHKSDSERILSLQMGFDVWKKNAAFGVGYGDIMDEVGKSYAAHFPNLDVREPHSFLLFNAVGTGVVGLLIFLLAFATHWYLGFKQNKMLLFSILHVLILAVNTLDFAVEGTYGATFYAFFVCLFLNHNLFNEKKLAF